MSLLDRFRAGTELDSVGHFTLDEKRAKNKMARFQLVRQHDFLLLVAQAVMASGCTSIEITTSDKVIALQASGVNLEQEKLSRLEDYLFDTRPESVPKVRGQNRSPFRKWWLLRRCALRQFR